MHFSLVAKLALKDFLFVDVVKCANWYFKQKSQVLTAKTQKWKQLQDAEMKAGTSTGWVAESRCQGLLYSSKEQRVSFCEKKTLQEPRCVRGSWHAQPLQVVVQPAPHASWRTCSPQALIKKSLDWHQVFNRGLWMMGSICATHIPESVHQGGKGSPASSQPAAPRWVAPPLTMGLAQRRKMTWLWMCIGCGILIDVCIVESIVPGPRWNLYDENTQNAAGLELFSWIITPPP